MYYMEEHLFSQPGVPPPQSSQGVSQILPPQLANSPKASPTLMVPLANQVTGLATRLKLAEERYANLSKRNQLTEESLMGFEKDIRLELKTFGKQLSDLRKKINEINSKLDSISGELGSVVRKQEFSVMEHYLDLWQPMQFITRDEAARLIRDAVFTSTQTTQSMQSTAQVQQAEQQIQQADKIKKPGDS